MKLWYHTENRRLREWGNNLFFLVVYVDCSFSTHFSLVSSLYCCLPSFSWFIDVIKGIVGVVTLLLLLLSQLLLPSDIIVTVFNLFSYVCSTLYGSVSPILLVIPISRSFFLILSVLWTDAAILNRGVIVVWTVKRVSCRYYISILRLYLKWWAYE